MWFFEKLNTPIAVVILLVLVLLVDGFLLYRYQRSLPDAPATADEVTTSTEEAAASSPATGEGSELRVDVRVVDEPALLTVQEDGRTVLDQENPPGFSGTFDADQEVRIQTNNAGATRVEANGEDFGLLGQGGEAGTWTFSIGAER